MPESPKRILIVDDSETNVDLLSRRLTRRGFHVVAASSGPEALALIGREEVDLVLLDVMMPGMTGIEVLEAVRRTRPPDVLPVIMATAKSDASDVVQALDMGANDYVTKPIELEVLLARMRVHLRQTTRPSPTTALPSSGYVTVGAILDRKYLLESVIGIGGFGTVYRCTHVALEKQVAVKVLHQHLLESEQAVRRFEQEGISSCRVRHPNAVAMLDAGTTAEGIPYLVMELLQGHSLAQELRARGALPLRRCASIIGPVCDALAEAHRAGIVHRDIKPGNILLSRDERGEEVVKVLDFGIAKLLEGQSGAPLSVGELAGTPEYMAPERLLGEGSEAPSDVYSVGATLYEMLAGKVPFKREGRNALQQALHQVRTTPTLLLSFRPDLPHDLVRVVMATLARNPSERPGLADLRATLDRWAAEWSEPEWPPPSLGEYIASLAGADGTYAGEKQTAPLESEAGLQPQADEASGTVPIAVHSGDVPPVQIEVCEPTLLESGDPRRKAR